MALDEQKLAHFLEVAGRETTPPGEAAAFLQRARRMLLDEGKTFANLMVATTELRLNADPLRFVSAGGLRGIVAKLEVELSEKKAALVEAEKARAGLEQDLEDAYTIKTRRVRADGTMSWKAFELEVMAALRQKKAWRAEFMHQYTADEDLDRPLDMDRWARSGIVPPAAAQFVSKLKPVSERPAPHRGWTKAEDDRILDLFKGSIVENRLPMSEVRIAHVVSKEFGRRVTLGSVKKSKQRSAIRAKSYEYIDAGVVNPKRLFDKLMDDFRPGDSPLSQNFVTGILEERGILASVT